MRYTSREEGWAGTSVEAWGEGEGGGGEGGVCDSLTVCHWLHNIHQLSREEEFLEQVTAVDQPVLAD